MHFGTNAVTPCPLPGADLREMDRHVRKVPVPLKKLENHERGKILPASIVGCRWKPV
jgi:hypothetical protein